MSKLTGRILQFGYICFYYLKHPLMLVKKLRSELSAKVIKVEKYAGNKKVSIIIVTYNALDYVKNCLESIEKTNYKNYEIVVVDNASQEDVRSFLKQKEQEGLIKLYLSQTNTYFAKGNNLGASVSAQDSEYYLLLNSDTEIISPDWLDVLLNNVDPAGGIISFGKTDIPTIRPDGWCYLISKKLYHEFGGMNEYYQMNWGISELTAKIGNAGHSVRSIVNPGNFVKHFGQKSHSKFVNSSQFNRMSEQEVLDLYKSVKVELFKIQ